ncbi:ABC transporter substrate-binding protein [Corynebacterium lactis]|nr:ABC transporter substrate-binding protein [Corynebacterium lactis]
MKRVATSMVSRRGFLRGAAAAIVAGSVGSAGVLSGCSVSNLDPADPKNRDGQEIRIGSAMFPESEILARIWAYALMDAGLKAEVVPQIGARDVYLEALEEGSIDIVPEYAGNLASYFGDVPAGADSTAVQEALRRNLPQGFGVLAVAPAESKDAYRITRATSEKYGVKSLEDMAGLPGKIRIGGGPELAKQPFGPMGLTKYYGIEKDRMQLVGYGDAGGPLTIQAVAQGAVDMANIFTTTPLMDSSGQKVDLVTLEDPKRMILAQNVVALGRMDTVDDRVRKILGEVSENLTTADLVRMNERSSGEEKAGSALIARQWLDSSRMNGR